MNAEETAETETETEPSLDDLTKDELLEEAERRGVETSSSMTKAEIRAAIEEADPRAISSFTKDYLGRNLITPATNSKDYLGRPTTATVDHLGRGLT